MAMPRAALSNTLWRMLAAALISAAISPAGVASGQKIFLQDYEATLDQLGSSVASLPQHPEQIESLQQSLPPEWTVDAGGTTYNVSTAWISDALGKMRADAANRKSLSDEITERLKAMRAEAEAARPGGTAMNSANARAQLDKILSEKEYGQGAEKSVFARIWEQVQRWIDWLLDHTIGEIVGSKSVRTVVLYGILILVFMGAGLWLVRSLRGLARAEKLEIDAVFPPGRKWRDWAKDALSAAGSGDYRAALHAAYWAGVFRLGEIGVFRLDRARTPREYLQALDEQQSRDVEDGGNGSQRGHEAENGPAGRRAAIVALTRSMEASWYGYVPATQHDFDEAVNYLEKLGCRLRSTVLTEKS